MHALVVSFDRLPASLLGCYGNEWIETPHADRLAAAGLVADQCWAARIGPCAGEQAFAATTCLNRLRTHQIRTHLFQEAGSQIDFREAHFDAVQHVDGERGPAAKPDRIPFAQLVRAVKSCWLESRTTNENSLLWLHARGLVIPAAPPAGFDDLYRDEFEDREVNFEAMSEVERQSHPSTTAGMMSLLDHWLGDLLQQVHGAQPTLVVFTAAQGATWQPPPNSFGELDALRSQETHIPLILHIHPPDAMKFSAGLRVRELLTSRDLGSLLSWWFDAAAKTGASFTDWLAGTTQAHAGRIVTHAASGASRISTPDWGAIFPPESPQDSLKPLLFRKPEDYWEVNNVSDVEPDALESLHGQARK